MRKQGEHEIDAKYHIEQTLEGPDTHFEPGSLRIVNTSSGEPIPIDEPLFLFRGRDILAVLVLRFYVLLCKAFGCVASHIEGVQDAHSKFLAFKRRHPDRMKQPGSTMVGQG
jgi:hypothetical protein